MTLEEVKSIVKGAKKNLLVVVGKSKIFLDLDYGKVMLSDVVFQYGWRVFSLDTIKSITADVTTLPHKGVSLGADPELFFLKDGVVLPSTEILDSKTAKVAEDGFQLELHPAPSSCRELFCNELQYCIIEARNIAKKVGATLSFNPGFSITDDVWKKTPSKTKMFGCNPTQSAYNEKIRKPTGLRYRYRSGAGHIHLGFGKKTKDLNDLVKILDIVLGNTLVLVDRSEDNILRRKVYGRAGEYRVKSYGLEYRVPSNFWLRHYVIMSFAFGLAREAYHIWDKGLGEDLLKSVNFTTLREAINENDREKALVTYEILKNFINSKKIFGYSISLTDLDKLDKFVNLNLIKTLKVETDDKILKHWESPRTGGGFEFFLDNILPKTN